MIKSENLNLQFTILQLADTIAHSSFVRPDGGVTWLKPRHIPGSDRCSITTADMSLYGGATGIAVFLAAVQTLEFSERRQDVIRGAIQPLLESLSYAADLPRVLHHVGFGACSGMGGYVYGLHLIAEFTQDEAVSLVLDQTMWNLAALKFVPGPSCGLDVVDGISGFVLCVSELERKNQTKLCASLIHSCCQFILSHAVTDQTGFAHGMSGIALAVGRAGMVYEREEWVRAAHDLLSVEDKHYSPIAGNWSAARDRGESSRRSFKAAWCYGAPGIAIARHAFQTNFDTEISFVDADQVLCTEHERILSETTCSSLCCGVSGILDALMICKPQFSGIPYRDQILADLAEQTVRLPHSTVRLPDPSLFQGLAGVGYQQLRLNAPDRFPSILSFEM